MKPVELVGAVIAVIALFSSLYFMWGVSDAIADLANKPTFGSRTLTEGLDALTSEARLGTNLTGLLTSLIALGVGFALPELGKLVERQDALLDLFSAARARRESQPPRDITESCGLAIDKRQRIL